MGMGIHLLRSSTVLGNSATMGWIIQPDQPGDQMIFSLGFKGSSPFLVLSKFWVSVPCLCICCMLISFAVSSMFFSQLVVLGNVMNFSLVN